MLPVQNGTNGNLKQQNSNCRWIIISWNSWDVPVELVSQGGLRFSWPRAILHLFLRDTPMFDELWSEIQDAPGEIFDMDIPELRDTEKFDVNEYLNANYDYWC